MEKTKGVGRRESEWEKFPGQNGLLPLGAFQG